MQITRPRAFLFGTFSSRFILLEILILTIGRIRLEFSENGDKAT